jgi:hypothetical protein
MSLSIVLLSELYPDQMILTHYIMALESPSLQIYILYYSALYNIYILIHMIPDLIYIIHHPQIYTLLPSLSIIATHYLIIQIVKV